MKCNVADLAFILTKLYETSVTIHVLGVDMLKNEIYTIFSEATLSKRSILCCYDYFCIITGGLFECFDDLEDPSLWQGLSEDPESQEQGRIDILQLANHIVPGHGKMFQVPETYKQHLRVVMYTEEHYEQTIGNRTTSTHQSEYVVIEETD